MMKVFLSKRHSKPALELKYYEKSGRSPKEIGENISSSSVITEAAIRRCSPRDVS